MNDDKKSYELAELLLEAANDKVQIVKVVFDILAEIDEAIVSYNLNRDTNRKNI